MKQGVSGGRFSSAVSGPRLEPLEVILMLQQRLVQDAKECKWQLLNLVVIVVVL